MEGYVSGDEEARVSNFGQKRGGWITFPFISGTLAGVMVAGFGWLQNLIVYLILEFNVESINAAQISNIVHGSVGLFPVIGAVLADSFLGCFSVISVFLCISLLGTIFLTLTATINALKPEPCVSASRLCNPTSQTQFAVLYAGIALATVGLGSTRFVLSTMGASQHNKQKDQATFFNWYFFTLYASAVVSTTAIVYIEDSVSWGLGFGICAAANFLGLVIFLLGSRFYRHRKPQGSPYIQIARVIVASVHKRNVSLSSNSDDYYNNPHEVMRIDAKTPANSFRFFNRAALKTEGDLKSDGTIARPWSLCTVQQVEDFKTLFRTFPLWLTSWFVFTPITMHSSLTVLQALAMDRRLGPTFKIPAGSIVVMLLVSTCATISFIDRLGYPLWQKLTGQSPKPLQRIAVGHMLNVLSMVVAALVESRRLKIAHDHHLQTLPRSVVPMSVLWLFPPLILAGIGEAFHFPGQVAFYYREFPASLQSSATAMIPLVIGIAFYLSTALIDLLRKVTTWLPANINNGRIDNVYWTLVVLGVINFGYYLVCAKLYNYQNVEEEMDSSSCLRTDGYTQTSKN